jgi:hypothetical protein
MFEMNHRDNLVYALRVLARDPEDSGVDDRRNPKEGLLNSLR